MIIFSIGIVWRRVGDPAVALAVGVIVGGALQLLIQVPLLVQHGMRFKFGISPSHPGIRAVARLMAPGVFGIGVAQINLYVDTVFPTAPKTPRRSIPSLYVPARVSQ